MSQQVTGNWFDRQDVYDNQYDFYNELVGNKELRDENDLNIIYDAVMDSSTTHFKAPTKALAYPMIWSFMISFLEDRIQYRENLVWPRKYLRIAKEVFFKRQQPNSV
jgi:hypothetical protein